MPCSKATGSGADSGVALHAMETLRSSGCEEDKEDDEDEELLHRLGVTL